MRNKYPGRCADGCGTWVEADAGYFETVALQPASTRRYKWRVRCIPCTVKAKLARGEKPEHMSRAQQRVCRELGLDLL